MAGNEVRVIVRADDQATGTLGKVAKAGEGMGSVMTKVSLAMTAGFVAGGIAAIKLGMDFERGLDQVQAVTGATAKEMEGLSAKAKQIGADTAFSASQAVDAMEALGAGGVKTADIMGGAADAVVALAAAGGTDLTTAAQVAATAMDVWGIAASDLTGIVNNVAGVANVSKFGVEDMAQAMAQGGTVAALAGVDFDDFSASIAATSSAFSSGSDAGTSFKTFITALANPTEKAKKAMDEIGFAAYDASGNLKSMAEITQNLHDSLGPLSEQQRSQAAATIFGSDAMRTALSLSKQTGEEFTNLSTTMKNTDAAAVAATRMSNLSGDMEALKGSVETLAIGIGTKAIPALANLTKTATAGVNAFGELPGPVQEGTLAFVGMTVAMPAAAAGIQKVASAIHTMTTSMTVAKVALGGFVVGLGAAVIAAYEWDKATSNATKVADKVKAAADSLSGMGAAADVTAFAMARLNAAMVVEVPSDFGRAIDESSIAVQSAKNEVAAMATVMKDGFTAGTVSLKQLTAASAGLPPEMKKIFDSGVGLSAILEGNALAAAKFQGEILTSAVAAQALGNAHASLGTAAVASKGVIEEWAGTVAEAKDGTKDFKQAIEDLTNQFAAANPTVIALTAQHALLTEELEDLKDFGDAATAADKRRIKVIEGELLPAIAKEIKHYSDDQKALEGMSGAVQGLIGEQGYFALIAVMRQLKVPADDQIALSGRISEAYDKLAKNDIPAAIGEFEKMKRALSPEVWAPIAEAVGPELSRKIRTGLTGAEAAAAVEAARSLGINIAQGAAGGVVAGSPAFFESLTRLIDDGFAAARARAAIQSPSKRAADEIGKPIVHGIAKGVEDGEGVLVAAVNSVVARALAAGAIAAGGAAGGGNPLITPTSGRDIIPGGIGGSGGPGPAIASGGSIPAVAGYDAVWTPGSGWAYVPHSYGGAPGVGPGGLPLADSAPPGTQHPGQYWDGSRWLSQNVNNPTGNPDFGQAFDNSPGYIDAATGLWALKPSGFSPTAFDNRGTAGGAPATTINLVVDGQVLASVVNAQNGRSY